MGAAGVDGREEFHVHMCIVGDRIPGLMRRGVPYMKSSTGERNSFS